MQLEQTRLRDTMAVLGHDSLLPVAVSQAYDSEEYPSSNIQKKIWIFNRKSTPNLAPQQNFHSVEQSF